MYASHDTEVACCDEGQWRKAVTETVGVAALMITVTTEGHLPIQKHGGCCSGLQMKLCRLMFFWTLLGIKMELRWKFVSVDRFGSLINKINAPIYMYRQIFGVVWDY